MSIAALRTSASVISGQRLEPLTITIHHSKLAQFLQSERTIGPLTCRELTAQFDRCYQKFFERAPHFPQYFPSAVSFLTAPKRMQQLDDTAGEKVISSLQLAFTNGFIAQISELTQRTFLQSQAPTQVFLTLKELSATIDLRQKEGRPFTDLIASSNRFFELASKLLNIKLIID